MSSSIIEQAVAAYDPIKAHRAEHEKKLTEERAIRAAGHFERVFGEQQTPAVEGGHIVFTIDKTHRLAYCGNLTQKREMCGPGWYYLERCGGCRGEEAVAYIQTIADLGKVLRDGTPEWECARCNTEAAKVARPGQTRRSILRR